MRRLLHSISLGGIILAQYIHAESLRNGKISQQLAFLKPRNTEKKKQADDILPANSFLLSLQESGALYAGLSDIKLRKIN